MPELKITKKITNGHQHVIYMGKEGFALASKAKDHTPEIMVDEAGAIFAVDPDGYKHEIVDYEILSDADKEPKEEETVKNVLADYQECYDYEKEARRGGNESEKIYAHDQWAASDKPPGNRAAVTINVIEDKIDNLTGYQKQNRTEPHFLPGEKGDAVVADILNIIVKDITNNCYYQREKSKVFEDEAIAGRGLFNVYEDYERDARGNIVIERFAWDEAFFGPHEKDDLSDCEVMFKTKWYSENKLKSLFPDKIEGKLKGFSPEQKGQDLKPELNQDGGLNMAAVELIDINAKKYRLLERWKKEYKSVDVAVFANDGFVEPLKGWDKKDVAAVKSIPGMSMIKRESYRMRKTRTVSDVLIDDEFITDMDYEIVSVYAKKRRGVFWGKIKGIIDLQQLINKTYSQFIDIIAKVANYGYFYDSETFDDVQEEKKWKEQGTSPGFTAKVANSNKIPVKEEGVKFPTEIVNAIQMFMNNIREIMNVNLNMQGLTGNPNESGVAIKQKIVQQLIGNDFLFDNMKFAEQLLFKVVVKKIQKLYTPERMMRILETENSKTSTVNPETQQKEGGVQLAGQPLEQYPPEQIKKLLQTVDLTEHDIIVSDAADSPSAMMGAYLMLLETARSGAPIPPDIFIELSPLPDNLKAKLMASLQAAQQAEAQKDQMKYGTEIKKAQIAQQGKMLDKNPMQQELSMGNMQGAI